MRIHRRLFPLILSAFLSATAFAAAPPFGDAPGFAVTTRSDGTAVAAGRLADVPPASAAGEILDGLRGAPGLAAARERADAQLVIEYRDDRVMRLAVSVPGGAATTLLNKPGGTTVDEIRLSAAASVLRLPANGAVRVRSVEGTGSARTVLVTGPLGDFPTAGPLADAPSALRTAVETHPSADVPIPTDATPVRVKTDAAGRLLSFRLPRPGSASGEVEYARDAAGALAPVPEKGAMPSPARVATTATGGDAGAPSAATFLTGPSPATRPFARGTPRGVEVTLNVADLTPEARARIGRDLPTNALAARLAAGTEPRGNNAKITLVGRDGGFAFTNVLPAAVVPSDPTTRAAADTSADSGTVPQTALNRAVPAASPAASKETRPRSDEPAVVGGPSTPRYFSSESVPSLGNTGANAATGQRALPSGYVAALSAARAALLNVPPAGMPGHAPALNTARARVTDLVTAFARLDSDGGFQRTPDADERRADLMGGKGRTGTFRAMNAAGVNPTPRQILAVFADVVRLNALRR